MLLSDSLFIQSTLLTGNFVHLVDGGLLLARLFISFFPSDRDLHPSGFWSFLGVVKCNSFWPYVRFCNKIDNAHWTLTLTYNFVYCVHDVHSCNIYCNRLGYCWRDSFCSSIAPRHWLQETHLVGYSTETNFTKIT